MVGNNKDFFWPSYVDLMTALFGVILVLFVFTYHNFKKKETELENLVEIKEKEAAILNKVKANLRLFEADKEIFLPDTVYNRILLAFDIQYRTGNQYYSITANDLKTDFHTTKGKLDVLGTRLKNIIDTLQYQKIHDSAMKDISYLLVISGSASNLPGDNEEDNYLLSYRRALSLYQYWKESLNLDFDSKKYHNIIELQISGSGTGGVGRFNSPFKKGNKREEEKNQRFIIHITPKIGG